MEKYLKQFANHTAYQTAESSLNKPNVSYCVQENEVHYKALDYSKDYLTFDILTDGTIKWGKVQYGPENDIEYSLDKGNTWTSLPINTTLNVQSGDILMFKGIHDYYGYSSDDTYYDRFDGTANFNVYGNVLSLFYGDNFIGKDEIPESEQQYCQLYRLFSTSNVVSAKNLILPKPNYNGIFGYMFYNCSLLEEAPQLPATTLAESCYAGMFGYCISLTKAPKLPATTLTSHCYAHMFNGCMSLTTAPELQSTTLADGCYDSMFESCTNLTTAPELPATTLVTTCYNNMFYRCSKLNYIKCLATDISANFCTHNWVTSVQTTSGTFVKNSSMNSWTTGVNGIPTNWTIQNV